jgi:hypothetical protein
VVVFEQERSILDQLQLRSRIATPVLLNAAPQQPVKFLLLPHPSSLLVDLTSPPRIWTPTSRLPHIDWGREAQALYGERSYGEHQSGSGHDP